MKLEQARHNMIEQQIRTWDVLDQSVLRTLVDVRREAFVPVAYQSLAFVDTEIPLPCGQHMLSPKLEARLLQEAALQDDELVVEIGAGSGYMAALLAGRAGSVVSMEIDPALAAMARANLARAGVTNARVVEGDGAQGLPAEGPFDVIVLSGSVAEVPKALLSQLKVGGRLVAIVGSEPVMRATRITRTGETSHATSQGWDTLAPRLPNFPEPSRFQF